MEERILRLCIIFISCTLLLFYVIGDDIVDGDATDVQTGETIEIYNECCIYHLIGDMILSLLRAGLHLLWFYYTFF